MNNNPPAATGPSMIAPIPQQPDPLDQQINLTRSARSSRRDDGRIFLIIGLVISILALLTFVGLFIWMYIRADEAETDRDGQVATAVANAEAALSEKLNKEFLEREKEPYKTFSGPEDYGELSFKYPKTWSVYVQGDAANGGNFQAYFSPGEVEPIKNDTPNALRLTISTQSFDSTAKTYQSYVTSGRMTMTVISVNGDNANYYEGTLPNSLSGAVCIIKIRDKTVVMQTDAEIYKKDFLSVLKTVTYNS